jgi:hypothetical protein
MLQQIEAEMQKYRLETVTILEIRWRGSGVLDAGNFILMYSGKESNTFGTD